jgi:hypothetical protein
VHYTITNDFRLGYLPICKSTTEEMIPRYSTEYDVWGEVINTICSPSCGTLTELLLHILQQRLTGVCRRKIIRFARLSFNACLLLMNHNSRLLLLSQRTWTMLHERASNIFFIDSLGERRQIIFFPIINPRFKSNVKKHKRLTGMDM